MQPVWLKTISQFTKDNSPAILSGIAVAGVIGTAILAVRATPKAIKRLEEKKEEGNPAILKTEVLEATWPYFVPAALTGAATIACIIGATKIGAKRNAALLAAYTLVDQGFREYKDHVLEEIGEAKEQKIHDKVMTDRAFFSQRLVGFSRPGADSSGR